MQQHDHHHSDDHKLLDLPSEIFELLVSYIPFKESYHFRVSHRYFLSAFLNYFRRTFRNYLNIYNEHLIDKFKLVNCDDDDDEYREMYQVEFERIQNEFNCKIPFILKELLMMTRHFNDESNGGTYSYSQYPAHWFNPIKSWKKEGNIVRISNCVGLVPNGKYNNLLLLISEFSSEVDLNYSLFYPNSSLFKIQGDSFPKYCKLDFNRGFAYSTSNITSIPLALCALKYFTTIDLSPRRISLLISRFSPDLFSNKEFLWKAVNIYYKIGEQIPEILLNDRDFCLRLVRSHGKALKYCTKFVKDKEIVTQALKQNGFAIKYISSQYLRSNQDLLEIAVESKPFSLNYVQNSTRNFKSMVVKALQNMKEMTTIPLFVDNDEFLQDKEIVEIILMKNPQLMEQMPNIWRECRPLARKMLSTKSSITGFSQKVIEDPRFFKMVAETKPTLLIEEKKDTSKLVKKVMNAWGLQFNHRDDEETMTKILELARKNPDIYSFMLQMPLFGCGYSDSLRFTFLKEGVSHDPLIICNKRVRNIVSLIDLEQQEEILKIFLNNSDNSKTISVTLSFDKQLLKQYALEGYKKGIKLCERLSVLCNTADDIAECFKRANINVDHSYLCLNDVFFKAKCYSYSLCH